MSSTCAHTSARSSTSVPVPSPNSPESRFATGAAPASYSLSDERDARRVPQQQRDDDPADPREDQVRLAEMAALEARRADDFPDPQRRRHPDEDQDGKDVGEQREPLLRAEPRKRRLAVDDGDHRHHDRREQHDEAPEDQRVHHARERPLEQLALAEHDDRLLPRAVRDRIGARDARRLAHAQEPHEQARPAGEHRPGQPERGGERGRADERRGHQPPWARRSSAVMAGTTSVTSPITA